jgi:voltage-gated potassium channel
MPTLARNQAAYDRFSAVVSGPMMVLTILWLPVLIVPLVWPVHGDVAETLAIIDYSVWALFAVEYAVKLWLAPTRWEFVKHHKLDLLIVAVPFFRPLRVGRVANLGRLGRVGVVMAEGLRRVKAMLTHKGLNYVLLVAGVVVVVCAALVTVAEHGAHGATIHNFGQGIWWAMVTVTTVGYGDRYPVTPTGQGIAVVLMLVGIGLIGVLTATVASFFVEQKTDDLHDRLERMEAMLVQLLADREAQS